MSPETAIALTALSALVANGALGAANVRMLLSLRSMAAEMQRRQHTLDKAIAKATENAQRAAEVIREYGAARRGMH